ncbi:hypothetical protein A6R68_20984, partial [Neotoma lepida]
MALPFKNQQWTESSEQKMLDVYQGHCAPDYKEQVGFELFLMKLNIFIVLSDTLTGLCCASAVHEGSEGAEHWKMFICQIPPTSQNLYPEPNHMVSNVRAIGHQLAIHLHFTVLHKANSAKSWTLCVASGLKLINRQKPNEQCFYLRQGQFYLRKRQVLLLTRNHLHQDLQGVREETGNTSIVFLLWSLSGGDTGLSGGWRLAVGTETQLLLTLGVL